MTETTADLRPLLGEGIAEELPNEFARTVGQKWLEEYGDYEDKAFVAVGVYRMMRLAMLEPDAPELERYR